MAKWVTHSHEDGLAFRPLETYMQAKTCSTCDAQSGWHCLIAHPRPGQKFHIRRQDKGAWHLQQDQGNAPWPEEREPDVCYSTIVGLCETA